MVAAARASGFNTLLVQVRGRGDAYYQSAIEPRAAELAAHPGFDPLASTISQAHAAGLRVHAWVAREPRFERRDAAVGSRARRVPTPGVADGAQGPGGATPRHRHPKPRIPGAARPLVASACRRGRGPVHLASAHCRRRARRRRRARAGDGLRARWRPSRLRSLPDRRVRLQPRCVGPVQGVGRARPLPCRAPVAAGARGAGPTGLSELLPRAVEGVPPFASHRRWSCACGPSSRRSGRQPS